MSYYYLVPPSFFAISIVIEVFFALIALSVAFVSLKIYKLSKQRETRLFGISFLLISVSYIVWAIMHFFVLFRAEEIFARLSIENISLLGKIAITIHALIFVSGLITLAYTTLKIKNSKVYYMMLGLSLIVIAASLNKLITFRILSVFILSFITYNYFGEYLRNKNKKTLIIFISFFLLLISNTDFIFSLKYYQAYIVGHIIEFIAYLFILASLIHTIRR
ncbi:MAG: hypothetical protein AABX73_01080 [Nanoarchaeota archaeon]